MEVAVCVAEKRKELGLLDKMMSLKWSKSKAMKMKKKKKEDMIEKNKLG